MASCTSVVLDPSDSAKEAEASSTANAAATARKFLFSKYKGTTDHIADDLSDCDGTTMPSLEAGTAATRARTGVFREGVRTMIASVEDEIVRSRGPIGSRRGRWRRRRRRKGRSRRTSTLGTARWLTEEQTASLVHVTRTLVEVERDSITCARGGLGSKKEKERVSVGVGGG
ncbi:hypothetical protein QJS10_CPB14g01633 [Acorus calamus]|uniref:Uncharacterized protein n=1 Tax=Acorus calamus TaxID=4465 RepID=A0AAV9DB91_ACOCL|nr:hypothetical protein QJS10_CPB14g01633 [Acorus calamus]